MLHANLEINPQKHLIRDNFCCFENTFVAQTKMIGYLLRKMNEDTGR